MKKIVIIISVILFSLITVLVLSNMRSVYFVNADTFETTKLTSFWFKQNEIEIKDKWFKDFDNGYVSGVILIKDAKEYAFIPYSYTKRDPEGDLPEFYSDSLNRVKAVQWHDKDKDEDIEVSFTNEQKLAIAVGTYSGTSYDRTEYGNGIYSIPIYKDDGSLYYYLQFAVSDSVGIREGFNDDKPAYILQEVIYTEVTVQDTTLFMPIHFVGGVGAEDANGTEHYYVDYKEHQIALEANFVPVPE